MDMRFQIKKGVIPAFAGMTILCDSSEYEYYFDCLNNMKSKMKIDNRFWVLFVGFIAVMILIELMGDPVNSWLRYDREQILAGQVWRLFTGHLVHLGWEHLLLNLAGLVLTYLVFYRYLADGQGVFAVFFIALGVSAGLLLFNPGLAWFVGLSGLLHGLLMFAALLAVFDKTNANRKFYIIFIILILIKIGYEQVIGPMPTSAVLKNYKIISDAHLYGAVSGVVLYIFTFLFRYYLMQIKRSTD